MGSPTPITPPSRAAPFLAPESELDDTLDRLVSGSTEERRSAMARLAARPVPEVLAVFLRGLVDEDPELRELAGQGLVGLGPWAVPALQALAHGRVDRVARRMARRVLRSIEGDRAQGTGPRSGVGTPAPAEAPRMLRILGVLHDVRNKIQAINLELETVAAEPRAAVPELRRALARAWQEAERMVLAPTTDGEALRAALGPPFAELAQLCQSWCAACAQNLAVLPPHVPETLERLERLLRSLDTVLADSVESAGPSEVDLAAERRALMHLVDARGLEDGQSFEVQLDPAAPALVRVAAVTLDRVLDNLVLNALRHTPRGKVRVELSVQADRLLVRVADEGSGIPPEKLARLFQPSAGRPSADAAGWGLGLSAMAQLLADQGGLIRARSQPGQGSVFEVELPIGSVVLHS